jgi:acyl-CoA thioesterase-2
VTVTQGERHLLISMSSFHAGPTSPEIADPAPPAPSPEELPVLQAWVGDPPPETRERSVNWVEQPPPLDLRIGEPPNFMGGPSTHGPRSHWMRVPRDVGDDALLHTALLAYASDYLLMDMVLRSHPERLADGPFVGFSLDHALWFHRPVRFDRWHLYTQQTQALFGHRGLVRGVIHDADGHLVASVMQDNLVRRAR